VRRLAERGHELLCICRPGAQVRSYQTVWWDASEPLPEGSFPNDVDVVVHLAQSRTFRNFPGDAQEMFGINVRMTAELLRWAANAGVKQFVLASSGSVYEPYLGRLHEDAALAPNSFLGATKLAAEVLAKPYGNVFKLSILRLFFPYGPAQRDRLIPDLIERVRTGRKIQLAEDGEGLSFTPTFIDDVSSVFAACVENAWTGTINVGAPGCVSIRRVTEIIGNILKTDPQYELVKRPAVVIDPDLSRLTERLDPAGFTPLDAGLRKTTGSLPS
jgi:nucleoside-diphosphate-sugar epimerase